MGPLKAIDLLLSLPLNGASLEPCHEVNPNLWQAWCEVKGRDPVEGSNVWTEMDIACSAEIMIRQYMRDLIAGDRKE